jgi:myo-inositol-1(or 4)-monophosphatase
MLNIAIRAARAAGDAIVRQMDRVHDIPVEIKNRNDFVTEVDKTAEEIIIGTIHASYPQHAILAEETGATGDNEYRWIIDPLDGTTNFLHGFPQFAVSIALQHKGILDQAVVYDPLRQELFTASRGQGAQLNNRRIRVSSQLNLEGALLGTGFPFKDNDLLEDYLNTFRAFFPMSSGIRRAGAASLDLAYLACGRLDGFWEFRLNIWDIAAGVLLIQEAGGLVGELSGGMDYLKSGNIVAANPKLFKVMQVQLKNLLAKTE